MFNQIIIIVLIIIIIMQNQRRDNINPLIRQVYRWHIASTQDSNPIIKMLHSNYAVGYIGALRSIATEDEIYLTTGLNINTLEKEATVQQDSALAEIAKKCNSIVPQSPAYNEYIQKIIGYDHDHDHDHDNFI